MACSRAWWLRAEPAGYGLVDADALGAVVAAGVAVAAAVAVAVGATEAGAVADGAGVALTPSIAALIWS